MKPKVTYEYLFLLANTFELASIHLKWSSSMLSDSDTFSLYALHSAKIIMKIQIKYIEIRNRNAWTLFDCESISISILWNMSMKYEYWSDPFELNYSCNEKRAAFNFEFRRRDLEHNHMLEIHSEYRIVAINAVDSKLITKQQTHCLMQSISHFLNFAI